MATNDTKLQKQPQEGAKLLLMGKIVGFIGLLFGAFFAYCAITGKFIYANVGEGNLSLIIIGLISACCVMCTGVLMFPTKRLKLILALSIIGMIASLIFLIGVAKMGWMAVLAGVIMLILGILGFFGLDAVRGLPVVHYLREMLGELKKLTWLTPKDLASHTVAVIVFVAAMALMIYVLDLLFSQGVGLLERINIG